MARGLWLLLERQWADVIDAVAGECSGRSMEPVGDESMMGGGDEGEQSLMENNL